MYADYAMHEIDVGKFSQWKDAMAFETKISLALIEKDLEDGLRAVAVVGVVAMRFILCPGDDILAVSLASATQARDSYTENANTPSQDGFRIRESNEKDIKDAVV